MYIDFTICTENNKLTELKDFFPNATLLSKGEKLKSGKIIDYYEFSFIFEKKDIVYVDELISLFKEHCESQFKNLDKYLQTNLFTSSICIVIKEDEEHPAISISNDNLLFLCKLNANIDFDFI